MELNLLFVFFCLSLYIYEYLVTVKGQLKLPHSAFYYLHPASAGNDILGAREVKAFT